MDFDPFDHIIRKTRRRKATRTQIRERNAGKKRTPHGGRGRKYGLKGCKNKRRKKVRIDLLFPAK